MQPSAPRASQTGAPQVFATLPERRQTGTPVVVSQQTIVRDPSTGALIQPPKPQDVVLHHERPVYQTRVQDVQCEVVREVPKMIEKVMEYPVEVLVEKPVEQRVTVDVVHEKFLDIPVEIINEVQTEQTFLHHRDVIIEKPVYVDRIVEKPVWQEVRVPKEYITTRDVPKVIEVPTEVERTVIQPIETQVVKRVEVRRPQVFETKDVIKEVHVPHDKVIDVQVPRYVDNIIEKEEIVEVPGRTIRREIPQSKDVVVNKPIYREIEVPVDVLITQDGQRLELGRRDATGRYPGLSLERSRSLSSQRASHFTTSRNFIPSTTIVPSTRVIASNQTEQPNQPPTRTSATFMTSTRQNPGTSTYTFGPDGGLVPANPAVSQPRISHGHQYTSKTQVFQTSQPATTIIRGNSFTNLGGVQTLNKVPSSGAIYPQQGQIYQRSSQEAGYTSAPATSYTINPGPAYASNSGTTVNYTWASQPQPAGLQPATQTYQTYSQPLQSQPPHSSYNPVVIRSDRSTKETFPRATSDTPLGLGRSTVPISPLRNEAPVRFSQGGTGIPQPTYSVGLSEAPSSQLRVSGQEVNRNLFSAGQVQGQLGGQTHAGLNNSSSGGDIRELAPSTARNQNNPGVSGLEPIPEVRHDSMQSSSMNGGYELGHDISTPPERPQTEHRGDPLSQPRFYQSEPRLGAHTTSASRFQNNTVNNSNLKEQRTSEVARPGSVSRKVISEQVRYPPGYRAGDQAVFVPRDKVIPKYVEQIIEKYRDVPVERKVEVFYETVREEIINHDVVQETEVEVVRCVPGPIEDVYVERPVEVIKVVEKPIYMTKKVQKIKEIIVEKEVEEPQEQFVERIIEKEIPVDIPISTITQRPSIVERPVDITTRRRRRTSLVNERLRSNLHESVERSNSVSRENAELQMKVRLLRERTNSVTTGESLMRPEKNRQEFESLKHTLEGLTERLTELEGMDRFARRTHQPPSN